MRIDYKRNIITDYFCSTVYTICYKTVYAKNALISYIFLICS